jgi:acetylornithine deacetylase/succinyl-diaminopimelate desuccinylase-like protein
MRRFSFYLLLAATLSAQSNPAAQAARQWREQREPAILREYIELLKIPNIARDLPDVRRNAEHIRTMMTRRGIDTRILELPNIPPLVTGRLTTPGATRTITFYAHYDGQPLDPKEWATPPFEPVLRDKPLDQGGKLMPLPAQGRLDPEWRLYARSASDDKAPIIALLTALDAMKAAGVKLRSNIQFIFEGEEEAGSPHLAEYLRTYKDQLKSDVWLLCDGPVDQSRRPQIVFGARGVKTLNITIYGPKRELHSGHYGNWAPNPAMMLSRLLASMKDDDGRVLIEGWYERVEPLSAREKQALAALPNNDAQLKDELWLGGTEGAGKRLPELLNLPSLNVRGMASARVGAGASNVIPASATATIDIRLVKGLDQAKAAELVIAHMRKQGYFITDKEPDAETRKAHAKVAWVQVESGYNAVRTSMDLPISREVVDTAKSVFGPIIELPTSGGSIPIYMIEQELAVPVILVPIVNHDNNQHSFNENVRLKNLWDGIDLLAALLAL